MGEKQQISLKLDSVLLAEFDKVREEYKDVSGMKPIRQEAIEVAMKDYIVKLRKQIEALKNL